MLSDVPPRALPGVGLRPGLDQGRRLPSPEDPGPYSGPRHAVEPRRAGSPWRRGGQGSCGQLPADRRRRPTSTSVCAVPDARLAAVDRLVDGDVGHATAAAGRGACARPSSTWLPAGQSTFDGQHAGGRARDGLAAPGGRSTTTATAVIGDGRTAFEATGTGRHVSMTAAVRAGEGVRCVLHPLHQPDYNPGGPGRPCACTAGDALDGAGRRSSQSSRPIRATSWSRRGRGIFDSWRRGRTRRAVLIDPAMPAIGSWEVISAVAALRHRLRVAAASRCCSYMTASPLSQAQRRRVAWPAAAVLSSATPAGGDPAGTWVRRKPLDLLRPARRGYASPAGRPRADADRRRSRSSPWSPPYPPRARSASRRPTVPRRPRPARPAGRGLLRARIGTTRTKRRPRRLRAGVAQADGV